MSTSNIIAEIKNLSLSYNVTYHRPDSLREVFIKAITRPVDFVFSNYDQHLVLDNISFDVLHGDRIGIIGVNGAGKTSLCRIISGMYTPSKGGVKTYGKIRAIFDTAIGIIDDLTGRENAQFLAELMFSDLSRKEKNDIVKDALEFSELGHFLDIPFKKYSKGMQARLCLSLISAHSSDLLILDEVFDGADEFFKKKISKRVLNMINNSGAVIFVSHSPDQILQTCNRVILIDNQKIAFDGNVKEGISIYQNLNKYG